MRVLRGITLFSLFNLALRHILVLILSAVVFAAAAFAYCELVATPIYSSTGSMLITNGALNITDVNEEGEPSGLQNTDVVASINFMDTATDMLKQNGIYKQLAQKMDNKYSYGQLKNMVTIERRKDNSLYVDISFKTTSAAQATVLVNEFMSLAPEYFKSQVKGVSVSFFETDSATKVSPQTSMTTILFAMLGAVITYSVFLVAFLFNTTITHEEDFKERFDMTVIGAIPDFAAARSKKYSKYYSKKNGYYNYYDNYGRGN